MKIAILSDVHGNLEALGAVLDDVRHAGVAEVWSLGDAVGYGPEPGACVETLRRAAAVNLMGNHDAAVAGLTDLENFNSNARRAVEWTRTVLEREAVDFLAGLPYEESRGNAFLVHASPEDPPAWHYIFSLLDVARSFERFEGKICLVGHTHVPFIIAAGSGEIEVIEEKSAAFRKDRRYLVNAGSVGQPRDGDPRAAYLILDDAEGTVEIRRVAYDVERTQSLMRGRRLPPFLIERLSRGR